MSSEALKTQLVQETREKALLLESAKLNLTNSIETYRKDLSESAMNFKSDLRDEVKKTREALEETAKNDRQKSERLVRQAEARLAASKRKFIIWGSVAVLLVALITAGLTMFVTLASVDKGTGMALNRLQQTEAEKLADLRAQAVTAQNDVTTAKNTLSDLKLETSKQEQLLAAAKERASHITTFQAPTGEIYAEVPVNAQPTPWKGKMIIQIKQKD